ncbi:lysine-rich arabinogalactan protein 19-like [Gossypium hirsutum]|uniref:Lysine-rich arabinogalactan protein 19-like n=1 Tax=Gossypium hirsutum TaxID=3635 RepID=A0A1U8JKD2_GOSHI|nr:lysine-rich arabinogalactan protein 19-like [Gossypium hirsutum]
MDDDASPSTRPRHSPGPSSAPIQSIGPAIAPTQSPDPAVQRMIPTEQPFQMMSGLSPWPGSSPFFITPSGPPMWLIVPTPTTRSLPEEPESPPEQPEPSPEARQRRNPARNHRRPPCGTESGGHED